MLNLLRLVARPQKSCRGVCPGVLHAALHNGDFLGTRKGTLELKQCGQQSAARAGQTQV